METPDYATYLTYLTLHLPGCVPLRLDVCRTLTDAEGWLEWARRVVADQGSGYAVGVQRESVGEVWQAVKEREGA